MRFPERLQHRKYDFQGVEVIWQALVQKFHFFRIYFPVGSTSFKNLLYSSYPMRQIKLAYRGTVLANV